MDMKLEVVVIPVSDVDRASDFYKTLGWRLDADVVDDDQVRSCSSPRRVRRARSNSVRAHHGRARHGPVAVSRRQRHRSRSRRAGRPRHRREPGVPLRIGLRVPVRRREHGPRVGPGAGRARPTRRSPHSPTPTATAGSSRRSRPGFRDGESHGCRDVGRAPARDGRTPRRVRGACAEARLVGLVRALSRRTVARKYTRRGTARGRPLHGGGSSHRPELTARREDDNRAFRHHPRRHLSRLRAARPHRAPSARSASSRATTR